MHPNTNTGNLAGVLDRIVNLNDDEVIFAREPWTLETEALIGRLDANCGIPASISEEGYAYFLEAHVAKEVLQVLGERKSTVEQRRALLLHYAQHDAYPQWVYQL